MNRNIMNVKWTIDGDETSWSSWADNITLNQASPLMQDLISANKPQHQGWALDVGCGTGRAFLPLVEAGYRVIGVDPILTCIRFCQQRILQAQITAYPVFASAAQIPLPAQTVSFVFAINSLFHLSIGELTNALAEIHRVLLSEGKALLHFLDRDDWRSTLGKEIFAEQAPIPSYQAVVTCFCSKESIKEWIEQAGLKLTDLELKTSSIVGGQQRNWLAICEK